MECELCREVYEEKKNIPRNLLCGHTFCEVCLEGILKVKGYIECPSCRSKLPSRLNVRELSKNFVALELGLKQKQLQKKLQQCYIHQNEFAIFFCEDCNENVCVGCIEDHSGHKFMKQQHSVELLKRRVESIREGILSFIVKLEENIEKQISDKSSKQIFMQEQIDLLDNHCDEIIKFINSKRQEMKDNYLSIATNNITDIELDLEIKNSLRESLQSSLAKMQSASQFLKGQQVITSDWPVNQIEELEEEVKQQINASETQFAKFSPRLPVIQLKTEVFQQMESLATINSLEGRICFFGDKNTILIYEIDIQQWTKQQLRETQEPQQLLDENEIPCYQDLPQYMQQTNLNRSIINNYSQIPSLSHKNSQQNSYQFNSYGASVSISGSRILIFGGGKSQQTLEITFVEGEIFSAAKKDMPLARKEHSAVILNNNKVLVMGGYNQQREEMLSSCHIYNYSDDSWTEVASMNVAKCAFAAAIDSNNQYIFTFGGFDSEKRLNLIERYDILNDVWEILDLQLPQPLSNAAAISFNERKPLTQSQISQNEGSIFILGGGHDEGFSHEVLKMNVEDLSLIKISDMDTGKDLRNKIIIDGNYLYTIGGNHFQNDRFDLLNQRWETLPSYFPLVVDNLDSWTQSFIITSSIIPVAAERKPKRQIQRKQSLKLNCYQIDPVQSKDYQNGISLGNLPPHLQIPSILLNQELNSQENIAEQEGINRRIKLVQPNQNR